MKILIRRKVEENIYSIIYNKNLSLNKQVDRLYKYFNQYEGYEYNECGLRFSIPSKKIILNMILDCYRIQEGYVCGVFDRMITSIVECKMKDFVDRNF